MIKKITITTSARLHFNSLKMNAIGGRGCGGVGLALESPILEMNFYPNKNISVVGGTSHFQKKSSLFAKAILNYIKKPGVTIKINKSFLNQIGLGSETQLGLSIGKGISLLYNHNLSLKKIASITKRAGISGIGYYAFFRGGLIIDGGYKMGLSEEKRTFADHASSPPPLTGNYKFPKNWKILLIIPRQSTIDVSKFDENKFFEENCPVPLKEVEAICTDVLMGLIPAVKESDYFNFIEYLSHLLNLGTKKIELELNKKRINETNKKLDGLLANKFIRIQKCKYILIPNNIVFTKKDLLRYTDLRQRYSTDIILNKLSLNNSEINRYLMDLQSLLTIKYPPNKIPFLGLSSLGATMYSILLSDYHKIDYILKETRKILRKDWLVMLVSARNKPAKINISYGSSKQK